MGMEARGDKNQSQIQRLETSTTKKKCNDILSRFRLGPQITYAGVDNNCTGLIPVKGSHGCSTLVVASTLGHRIGYEQVRPSLEACGASALIAHNNDSKILLQVRIHARLDSCFPTLTAQH